MVRLLVRLVVFLGATALGLVIAGVLVDGLSAGWRGFVVAVVIIAALQSVLAVFYVPLVWWFYVRPVASLGPSGHEPLRPCDTGGHRAGRRGHRAVRLPTSRTTGPVTVR